MNQIEECSHLGGQFVDIGQALAKNLTNIRMALLSAAYSLHF